MYYNLQLSIPLKHIQLCPYLYIMFSNLSVVTKGCNNELSKTMAYIVLLIYVWHIQTYCLEFSIRGQFGGYIRFLLWFRSCDLQTCEMALLKSVVCVGVY